MPFALTQLFIHKVPILLSCLARVSFISGILIKDWQHANLLVIKRIFLFLSFGFRSFERLLIEICLCFIIVFDLCTAVHPCISEHLVICSWLLWEWLTLPTCCTTQAKEKLFGSTKGPRLLPKKKPNPQTPHIKPTVAGKEYLYWKRSFQTVIYWADDTNKLAVPNSIPWTITAKYNFNQIWLLWLKDDSVPRCWADNHTPRGLHFVWHV